MTLIVAGAFVISYQGSQIAFGALLALYGTLAGALMPIPTESLAVLMFSAFIVSIVAFVLLFKAYQTADLSKVAVINAAEPLVILAYSFAAFGSLPSSTQTMGGAIIILGTFTLIYFRKKPKLPVMED